MLVEQVFPKIIGDKAPLKDRFAAEARDMGLDSEHIHELMSILPLEIRDFAVSVRGTF